MLKTEYKVLIEAIRGVKKDVQSLTEDVGRIDEDLGKDREDMQNFRVDLASMKEEIRTLKSMSVTNATHVQQKVGDVLEPAVKEISDLKDVIKKKKTLYIFKDGFKDWCQSKWMATVGKFGKEIRKEIRESR
jgi:chromosome segregation ATPase